MHKWWLAGMCFGLLLPAVSLADQVATLRSPFLSAQEYLRLSGPRPPSDIQVRFRAAGDTDGGGVTEGDVVVDVAADWAQLSTGGETRLFDFALQRTFRLDKQARTFVTANLSAVPFGRIWSRFSRDGQRFAAETMGLETVDRCETDTELGVSISLMMHETVSVVDDSATARHAECSGRTISGVVTDAAAAAPAALWPVIAEAFPIHPMLLAAARDNGKMPVHLEAAYRVTSLTLSSGAITVRAVSRTWDLTSRGPGGLAFPLDAGYRNATLEGLATATSPSVATLARDVLSGTHPAPTPESWDAKLAQLHTTDPVAATFAAIPGVLMFPQSSACASGKMPTACLLLTRWARGEQKDPAARAAFAILSTDTSNVENARAARDRVFEAMAAAQNSPHAADPVLRAAFANFVAVLGPEITDTGSPGFATDIKAARFAVLEAYPFTPSYWVDLGSWILDQNRFEFAGIDYGFLMDTWEVAMTLPLQEARASNGNLVRLAQEMAYIRRECPQFFLQ